MYDVSIRLLPKVLTIFQPLAARHEVANRLSRSRDAILAGNFRQAWSSMQAVFSQLLMSNYVRFQVVVFTSGTMY